MKNHVDENNYPLFDGLVDLKQKPMKTAMQELMENVDYLKTMGVTIHWEKYLEKEKQQIMNAYEHGYEACDMDEAMEVNKKLTSGDLYYNMNYNQNK